jgi:hypothetical protein
MYSGNAGLESRPAHRLSWLRLCGCLEYIQAHTAQVSPQATTISFPNRRHIIWDTEIVGRPINQKQSKAFKKLKKVLSCTAYPYCYSVGVSATWNSVGVSATWNPTGADDSCASCQPPPASRIVNFSVWAIFFFFRINPRSHLRTDLTQSKLLTSNYGCNVLLTILKDQRFLHLNRTNKFTKTLHYGHRVILRTNNHNFPIKVRILFYPLLLHFRKSITTVS